jgi:hypothetical protein
MKLPRALPLIISLLLSLTVAVVWIRSVSRYEDVRFYVPPWVFLALFMIVPLCSAIKLVRQVRRARRIAAGKCPVCGYDLRATSGRCPECGHDSDVCIRATQS